MTKLIILVAIFLPAILLSQNVAINNDGSEPHQSALLDISSTTKGIMIPRMTTMQRQLISPPVIGLTVFDVDTYTYWVYRGDINGGWREMLMDFDKHWNKVGTHIFSTNSGNVGIGTNTPASKLTINDTDPIIALMNNGTAISSIQASSFDMKINTHPDNPVGKIILGTKGNDYFFIDHLGRVSIGTPTLSNALTINGNNPMLQMQHNNVNKGYLHAENQNFILGTNSINTLGSLVLQTKDLQRLVINPDGQVGIGTSNPGSVLTVNGNDPILQLRNANINKGAFQLVGNDVKIGTNGSNLSGKFFIRTNGDDRVVVDDDGKVGINYTGPQFSMLAVGQNNSGDAGIDFYNDQNVRRGNIRFSNNHSYLRSEGTGKFNISVANAGHGIVLHPQGNISMGNNSMNDQGYINGYKLSIYGKATATEFTITALNQWPDYVFDDGYKLKPLSEVRKFINENKHLPNIPSAAQIEKEGLPLGDMSKKLMEKVEELTLYVIQLQEQIDELKKNK